MKRLVDFISDPKHQIRWWATWTVLWAILTPVTLLTGLRNSVPWLEWLSLYANFASCGTALVAAWSYFRARNVDEKVDSAAHFQKIEDLEQELARQGRDHGAALSELLELVRTAPLPSEPVPRGPQIFPPRPPSSDSIVGG